jgi:flagellar M-ring protein FliF
LSPYGEIKKLSVAVMVDGSYKTKGDGTYEYLPRPAKELTKLENLVKGAMGFDDKRGDQLQLVNVPFDNSELGLEADKMGEGQWQDWLIPLLPVLKKSLSLIVLLILFSLFILRPLLSWLSHTGQELSIPKGLPKKLKELEVESSTSGIEAPELDSRAKVLEIAKSDPGRTAQLAKEWLSEGE